MNCKNCKRLLVMRDAQGLTQPNVWEHRGLCNACGPMFFKKVRNENGQEHEVSVEDIMEAARKRVRISQIEAERKKQETLAQMDNSAFRWADTVLPERKRDNPYWRSVVWRKIELPMMALTDEQRRVVNELRERYAAVQMENQHST